MRGQLNRDAVTKLVEHVGELGLRLAVPAHRRRSRSAQRHVSEMSGIAQHTFATTNIIDSII